MFELINDLKNYMIYSSCFSLTSNDFYGLWSYLVPKNCFDFWTSHLIPLFFVALWASRIEYRNHLISREVKISCLNLGFIWSYFDSVTNCWILLILSNRYWFLAEVSFLLFVLSLRPNNIQPCWPFNAAVIKWISSCTMHFTTKYQLLNVSFLFVIW